MLRAGMETVVRHSAELSFVGALTLDEVRDGFEEMRADLLLIALPALDEEWLSTLSEYALPLVVLSELPDAAIASAAMRTNVQALLTADSSEPEIHAAIGAAAAGLRVMSSSVLELLSNGRIRTAPKLDEPLSAREMEVLTLLTEGLSNKLIAYRLGISEHTAKFHVTSVMSKLQAASRTDAVMQAVRLGLILI